MSNVQIQFKGNPPMMDFTLIKLNSGENLIDNQGGTIASLGAGELAKIVTDAGQALLKSLEATLAEMDPNQCVRVQLLLHGNAGYSFVSPMAQPQPNFFDKTKFILGSQNDPNAVINAVPRGGNAPKPVKNIIIVGTNLVNNESNDGSTPIRHATLNDNEDNSGADIINAE